MSKWMPTNNLSNHALLTLFGGGKKSTPEDGATSISMITSTSVKDNSRTATAEKYHYNYRPPMPKLVDAVHQETRQDSTDRKEQVERRSSHVSSSSSVENDDKRIFAVKKDDSKTRAIAKSDTTLKQQEKPQQTSQSNGKLRVNANSVVTNVKSRGRSKSPRDPSRQRSKSPRNLSKNKTPPPDAKTITSASTSLYSAQTQKVSHHYHASATNNVWLSMHGLSGVGATTVATNGRNINDTSRSKGLLPFQYNKTRDTDMNPISSTPSFRQRMEQAMAAAIRSEDDDGDTMTAATNNAGALSANDLAAGQMMRWKAEAEEGPWLLQLLAFFLAVICMGTALYPIVMDSSYWNVTSGIVAVHTALLCVLILVFELRSVGARGPLNARANLRALFSRYVNVLRLLWGRAILYIFAGSMNVAVGWRLCSYSGCALMTLGVMALLVGSRASFNLDRLKSSVTDEVYLWTKFDAADVDGDELIGVDGFSAMVWSLGLEINDIHTYETFVSIDRDRNGLISFDDFKEWWFAGQEANKNGGFVKRIFV